MGLTAEQLRDGIDAVAAHEPRIAEALAKAGYPEPRLRGQLGRGDEAGQEVLKAAVVRLGWGLVCDVEVRRLKQLMALDPGGQAAF